MPIYVIDTIQQQGVGNFPLIIDEDLQGGFRVVADTTARDNIATPFRSEGMFVFTTSTGQLWYLTGPVTGNAWVEWTSGGGASSALTDTLSAGEDIAAGDPVAINTSGVAYNADAKEGAGFRQEVHGLAISDALSGSAVQVTTYGVLPYVGAVALPAPGTPLYLGRGTGVLGSWVVTPDTSTPLSRITRLGQVRTSNSILVRVQLIAVV